MKKIFITFNEDKIVNALIENPTVFAYKIKHGLTY